MKTSLIIFLSILCFIIIVSIFIVILKKKMSLKYSLLWLIFALMFLLSLIFHGLIEKFAKFLGFEAASNMVFLIGFLLLMSITFALTSIISIQKEKIVILTQELAILKKKVKELDERDYL